jgi:hypothetical protein
MRPRAAHGAERADGDEAEVVIEPRWPIAVTLLAYIALTIVLRLAQPKRESFGPHWVVPVLEIALLLALIAANPAHLVGRVKWLRPLAITLIAALMALALLSTVVLLDDIITGKKVTQSATSLLSSGALIWLGNALVFSLLNWELDSGGPLGRYQHRLRYPDFAFSQHLNPELAPPGWRPQSVDYLLLGITTSTAFSHTDVMPIKAWAKLTMGLQSLLSLTVRGLVVARAVNAFT